MSKRHTIDDAKELALSKNGKCLSEEYINNKQKLLWECELGHQWEASFNVISLNHWCPYCAGVNKLDLNVAIELANNKNGKCLSEKYLNANHKLLWECEHLHQWEATLNSVKRGSWCPYCAGRYNNSIELCREVALSRGGKCLSEIYKSGTIKMEWECAEGHRWFAVFESIKLAGRWCPYCSDCVKHTIHDCKELAVKNKGICLSEEYINARIKMRWQCKNGHIWDSYLSNIKSGNWCPYCASGKTQKLLNDFLKDILKTETMLNFRGFDWLKDKSRLEIDIWVPDLKLAIEYDGIQHFEPVEHFGGEDRFKESKKKDKLKNKLIKKHTEEIKHFIRFNYKEDITEEYVRVKLIKEGVL